MKISRLREILESAAATRGDIEVRIPDPGCGCCSSLRWTEDIREAFVLDEDQSHSGAFLSLGHNRGDDPAYADAGDPKVWSYTQRKMVTP